MTLETPSRVKARLRVAAHKAEITVKAEVPGSEA